uniref:Uncharacterized protein n=1 Tax=Arundo donax TaxID=35708 RepID=A0A0A9BTA9_ARUDO
MWCQKFGDYLKRLGQRKLQKLELKQAQYNSIRMWQTSLIPNFCQDIATH